MSTLLNQGAYGCVFYPGIDCQGKPYATKKYVTKVQRKGYSATNEEEISKIIRTIPDYQLFFVPVESSCSIELSAIGKKLAKECRVMKKETDMKSEYVLMRMGHIESVHFFAYITDSAEKKAFLFTNMISTLGHLLTGVGYLLDRNIVHFDLKSENILYSASNNLPLMIDFGISLDMSKVQKDNLANHFYVSVPQYYVWPFDVHLLCFISRLVPEDGVLQQENVVEMASTYVSYNKSLEIYSPEFREKYREKCLNYGGKFVGRKRDLVIDELLEGYRTWDTYSLSILFLRFVSYLFGRGFNKSKFLVLFTQLLLENCSPDPRDRHSHSETLKRVNMIFSSKTSAQELSDLLETMDVDAVEVQELINTDEVKLPDKK